MPGAARGLTAAPRRRDQPRPSSSRPEDEGRVPVEALLEEALVAEAEHRDARGPRPAARWAVAGRLRRRRSPSSATRSRAAGRSSRRRRGPRWTGPARRGARGRCPPGCPRARAPRGRGARATGRAAAAGTRGLLPARSRPRRRRGRGRSTPARTSRAAPPASPARRLGHARPRATDPRCGDDTPAAPRIRSSPHQPGPEGDPHERRPLLDLGQVLDVEAPVELAQVRLDGVDAECSSAAICSLVAGVHGPVSARHGRQRASRTRRCAADSGGGGASRDSGSGRPARARGGRAEHQRRVPRADDVAVAQLPPPPDPLLVDVGAVARQAVVLDRPLAADALELGVGARDAVVPVERESLVAARPMTASSALSPRRTMRWAPSRRDRRERVAGGLGLANADPVLRIGGPGGSVGHGPPAVGLESTPSAGWTAGSVSHRARCDGADTQGAIA